MFRNIVIALHGDISARAVPFAEGIAQRWGGHLVVLHAIGRGAHTSHPPRVDLHPVVQQPRDSGIDGAAAVRAEVPSQAIAGVARDHDAVQLCSAGFADAAAEATARAAEASSTAADATREMAETADKQLEELRLAPKRWCAHTCM